VAAVIVGARNQSHALANAKIMDVALDAEDRARIAAVIAQSSGPLGDVYALERDRHGRHGSIMHYNLNAGKK
jgi:diketogulonate reductase-like aldo/keto reductase